MAPNLFSDDFENDEGYGCWVSQQPRRTSEISRMLDVMAAQDIGCIRYAGDDPSVIEELGERGESNQCDVGHR